MSSLQTVRSTLGLGELLGRARQGERAQREAEVAQRDVVEARLKDEVDDTVAIACLLGGTAPFRVLPRGAACRVPRRRPVGAGRGCAVRRPSSAGTERDASAHGPMAPVLLASAISRSTVWNRFLDSRRGSGTISDGGRKPWGRTHARFRPLSAPEPRCRPNDGAREGTVSVWRYRRFWFVGRAVRRGSVSSSSRWRWSSWGRTRSP